MISSQPRKLARYYATFNYGDLEAPLLSILPFIGHGAALELLPLPNLPSLANYDVMPFVGHGTAPKPLPLAHCPSPEHNDVMPSYVTS
jgi:hypothetical protein